MSAAASNQVPTGGYGGSSSQLGNSSEAVKTDMTHNMRSDSNKAALIKQGSNEGSNNNDMGSTTKNGFTNRPAPAKEKVSSPSAAKSNQHTSAFHPVQLLVAAQAPAPAASPQTVQAKFKEVAPVATATTKVVPGQTKEIYLEHHHHHHYHHIHHHHDIQGLQQHNPSQPPMDHGMTMGCSSVTGTPSQTMITVPVEGQAANYSMNASNSGSNHGSNGQNGGSTNVHAGRVNVESANVVAEKSEALNGNGNGSGSGSGSGVYQDRLAQRKAALNKFKQKRKERNFNKKVTLV